LVNSERELLFGVLSVQLGFANAHKVMTCAVDWVERREPNRRFEDFLVEQGALKPVHKAMVDGVVNEVMADGAKYDTLVTMTRGGAWEQMISSETELRTEPPDGGSFDSLSDTDQVVLEARGRYEYATGPGGESLVLGKGGIGQVIVVNDRFLGRDVALKELLIEEKKMATEDLTARSSAVEARFLREARVTGQLEHPAIVTVYELGRHRDGGSYYTMTRIKGSTLHDAIKLADTLEDRLKLLSHFVDACNALAYAHSRNVVHRDVKPQNVMIGPFGETYVLDWGLARVKGRTDPRASDMRMAPDITGNMLRGAAIGTPAYMSPEQASGNLDSIDERSDVWGLGALLYEILTGRPPYNGQTPLEVVAKILRDPVVSVRSRAPGVPPELATICERALQKDLNRRYPTASALKEDIEAYVSGRRVSAHTYSSWDLAVRFMRQNRVGLSVLASMLLAVVVWGAVVYQRLRAERDDAQEFAQLFLEDVSTRLSPVPGAAPLVEQLASRALEHYRKNVDPRRSPLEERIRLSKAYHRIGLISFEVGRAQEALQSFRYAREVAEGVLLDAPHEVKNRVLVANALVGEFDATLAITGKPDEWSRLLQAKAEIELAAKQSPTDVEVLDAQSRIYSRMGTTYLNKGERAIGLPWLNMAMQTDERIVAIKPDDLSLRRGLAITISQTGAAEEDEGRFDVAEGLYRKSLALDEELVRQDAQNRQYLELLALQRLQLGAILRRRGNEDAAKPLLERCVAGLSSLVAADPNTVTYHSLLAQALLERGDFEKLHTVAKNLEALTSGPEVGHLLIIDDVLQGNLDSAEKRVAAGTVMRPSTSHIFGSAIAALRGDRAAALERVRAARIARLQDFPDWSVGHIVVPEKLKSPEAQAVRAFFSEVDAAYAHADTSAQRLAIEHFERRLLELPAK
jgi:tetratricopeptide (TPR) repeat protein/tRNA A-37 threonylcarbamoyl transferase component Bud32